MHFGALVKALGTFTRNAIVLFAENSFVVVKKNIKITMSPTFVFVVSWRLVPDVSLERNYVKTFS